MTTVVVGLDGGSFELIEPWMKTGDMPTLARLVDTGVSTDMKSCLPPVTCPNWQCYATGTNPGKLGVFWWEHIDRAERRITNTSSSECFDGQYFWEGLEGRTAVVNLPTSYPPPESGGIHVAGGPGAQQDGYTTPASLEGELEANHGYQIHPDSMSLLSSSDPDSQCVEEIYDLIDSRFDIVEELLDSGDLEFVHVTLFYLNVLQHFFWDHDVVKQAWKQIDDRLGSLVDRPDIEYTFLMSDHGANEIEVTFNINTWLEREGYLVTKRGKSDILHRAGITRERIQSALGTLGIEWWARRFVPRRIQTVLPGSDGTVDKSGKEDVIDWDASRAVASGQGPVYVLETDPSERARIRSELRSKLSGLSHDGTIVVENAVAGEELYDGPAVVSGPDLVLEQGPGIHIQGRIGEDSVFDEPSRWCGENKDTGMFVAAGPEIRPDADLSDMHILDIAPTLLHLHDHAIPKRMDGRARTELFACDSDPATRSVEIRRQQASDTRSRRDAATDDVTDRLDDLGYLE